MAPAWPGPVIYCGQEDAEEVMWERWDSAWPQTPLW